MPAIPASVAATSRGLHRVAWSWLRLTAARVSSALRPLPIPDGRYEVRRKRDIRAFMRIFLLMQMGYSVSGILFAGPTSLSSDGMVASIAAVAIFGSSAILLLLLTRRGSLRHADAIGLGAACVGLGEALFGQFQNPASVDAIAMYEGIAIAVAAFAVPWRPSVHYLFIGLASVVALAGTSQVGDQVERAAIIGAFGFATAIAVLGKPLRWNSRVRDHLQARQIQRLNEALRRVSNHDPLTGLETRRAFDAYVDRLTRQPAGLIVFAMIDIDDFKKVNDTYGHPVGDDVLRKVGATILASLRGPDHAFRYGGEELMVVLDRADLRAGERIAKRMVERVEQLALPNPLASRGRVTISVGVAAVAAPATLEALQGAIAAADVALYAAKQQGKNRAVTAPEFLEAIT